MAAKKKINQISGVVRVVEIDYPYFGCSWTEKGQCVESHGPKRTRVTIVWDGGGESALPFPLIANPGDRFTFTIRPAT